LLAFEFDDSIEELAPQDSLSQCAHHTASGLRQVLGYSESQGVRCRLLRTAPARPHATGSKHIDNFASTPGDILAGSTLLPGVGHGRFYFSDKISWQSPIPPSENGDVDRARRGVTAPLVGRTPETSSLGITCLVRSFVERRSQERICCRMFFSRVVPGKNGSLFMAARKVADLAQRSGRTSGKEASLPMCSCSRWAGRKPAEENR